MGSVNLSHPVGSPCHPNATNVLEALREAGQLDLQDFLPLFSAMRHKIWTPHHMVERDFQWRRGWRGEPM
jgi:hypothetical protein